MKRCWDEQELIGELQRIEGKTSLLFRIAEAGRPDNYPILTRPINWDLIRRQYDEMIKYATALHLGTA